MAYPPLPDEAAAYPDRFRFPAVPERAVPEEGDDKEIESFVAPRGVSESESSGISYPKRLEFGVARIWVTAPEAPGPSVSYHEGQTGRSGTDGEAGICFAPGHDTPEICWEILNLALVKSVGLELYCRGRAEPIAVAKWGGDAMDTFRALCEQKGTSGDKKIPIFAGSLPWKNFLDNATVKIDPTLEVDEDVKAFPDGDLTVARSPYQLRMLVSRADAIRSSTAGVPGDDELGFPLIAWTYIHVLVGKLELLPGDVWAIPKERAPKDKFFDRDTWGTKVLGYEKKLVAEMRKDVCDGQGALKKDQEHKVKLPSTLASQDNNGAATSDLHFRAYRAMWGEGPRLPIFARVLVKNAKGEAVADGPAVSGLKLLWDWDDKTPADHDHAAAPTPKAAALDGDHHACTKEYFAKTLNSFVKTSAEQGFAPRASDNCHRRHGGKRGQGAQPIFPEQDGTPGATVEDGKFPFKVEPCPDRKWAALSVLRPVKCFLDDARAAEVEVQGGVLFQPSRMAGDAYRVAAYVCLDGLLDGTFPDDQTGAQLRAGYELPKAWTGIFEIWREVEGRILRKGPDAMTINRDTVRAPFLAACMDLALPNATLVDSNAWAAGADKFRKNVPFSLKNKFRPWARWGWPTRFDSSFGLHFLTRDELKQEMRAYGKIWELTTTTFVDNPRPLSLVLDKYGKQTRILWATKSPQGTYVLLVENANGVKFKKDHEVQITDKSVTVTLTRAKKRSGRTARALLDRAVDDEYDSSDKACGVAGSICQSIQAYYLEERHADEAGIFMFLYQDVAPVRDPSEAPLAGAAHSTSATPTRANIYTALNTQSAYNLDSLKAPDVVTAHEFGHGLFLNHSPSLTITENDKIHVAPSPNFSDPANGKDCMMNYDPDTRRLCGVCNLTLRGWSVFGAGDEKNEDGDLLGLSPDAIKNDVQWAIRKITATLPNVAPRTVGLKKSGLGVPSKTDTMIFESLSDDPKKFELVVLFASLKEGADSGVVLEVDATLGLGDTLVWDTQRAGSGGGLDITPLTADLRKIEVWPSEVGQFNLRVGVANGKDGTFDETTQHISFNLEVVAVLVNEIKAMVPPTPSLSERLLDGKDQPNETYSTEVDEWVPPPFRKGGSRMIDFLDHAKNEPLVLMSNSVHAGQTPLTLALDAEVGRHAQMELLPMRMDDADEVEALSPNEYPTISAGGNPKEFEIATDAIGSFYFSVGAKTAAKTEWSAETFNLVLVGVEHVSDQHQFSNPGGVTLTAGELRIHTRDSPNETFKYGDNVPVHLKSVVNLVGGGEDGLTGLNKVRCGWVNNIHADDVKMHYEHPNHDQQTVVGMHVHRNPGGANPAENLLVPPIAAATPVVDKGGRHDLVGWNGAAAVLSCSKPNGDLSKEWTPADDGIGAKVTVETLDAPMQGPDVVLPGNSWYVLKRTEWTVRFRCNLCFWTNDSDKVARTTDPGSRLLTVVETVPWGVDADYESEGETVTTVNTAVNVSHSPPVIHNGGHGVPAGSLEIELYPPGAGQYQKWRRLDQQVPPNPVGLLASSDPKDD